MISMAMMIFPVSDLRHLGPVLLRDQLHGTEERHEATLRRTSKNDILNVDDDDFGDVVETGDVKGTESVTSQRRRNRR